MAASTATYGTGYNATVVITAGGTSTTYSNAKVFELPDATAGVVNITHLGGFQKQPDGRTDYGKVTITIPQDKASLIVDKTCTVTLTVPQLSTSTYTNTSAYCISDSGGSAQRGQSVDRKLTFELLADGSWA